MKKKVLATIMSRSMRVKDIEKAVSGAVSSVLSKLHQNEDSSGDDFLAKRNSDKGKRKKKKEHEFGGNQRKHSRSTDSEDDECYSPVEKK